MRPALVVGVVAITMAGCAGASSSRVGTVGEIAGRWQGRMALPLANAAATMDVEETGVYRGALHSDAGEQPFSGAIVRLPTGRLRYQGSHGNGIVLITPSPLTLRFVPDGGGGGGSFTRLR